MRRFVIGLLAATALTALTMTSALACGGVIWGT
jgi:hypothetical protein